MKIVLMGPKGAGKSSVGNILAEMTGFQTAETDTMVEDLHESRDGHRLTCREVFAEHGEGFFRSIEREAALAAAELDWHIVITGGSLMLDPDNRRVLRDGSLLVYLVGKPDVLWERAMAAEKLDDPDAAARSYERLISEFPDSNYTGRASNALRSLDEEEDEGDDE